MIEETEELAPTPLETALREHERVWNEHDLLRRLYRSWFRSVGARLANVDGLSVELGSGIARFQELYPHVIATDVEPTPWVREVVDAEAMTWGNGELANVVLIDVFHHLPRPARFLDEAVRVLASGGRVVLMEPYCSPVSAWAYRRFHHERTDLDAEPFEDDPRLAVSPLESNQARSTLAFFRGIDEFRQRWPELVVVERQLLAPLVYPLVGGFSRPRLIPRALFGPATAFERVLTPLLPLTAFRCLVVLERS